MPFFDQKEDKYRPKRPVIEEWKSFRKGLNLLLRETELDNEELALADNIMLVGKGVPTGRWGTSKYFAANATGSIRGFATYKSNDGTTDEFMALTDQGYLAKKSSSSSSVVSGQSWPSGSIIRAAQLGGETFIVSKDRALTKYSGSDLSTFSNIDAPTGLGVSNFSGASGPNSLSYKISAIAVSGGQTEGSDSYVLADTPSEPSDSSYHLFWTAPSAATLSGYEIYRGRQGDEKLLVTVGPDKTSYVDNGSATAITIEAPIINTTGGAESPFIVKYKDRLLVVDDSDPNRLMISGRYPNHYKFSWYHGGGYVYIDPDSGDNITGIAVQPVADRIIVYKNHSSYVVELGLVQIGNYWILDPSYQTVSNSVGCCGQDTLAAVENDTFYFGRDGVYVTGYEPNFLNIIRTNEISAKMRPYLAKLNSDDYDTATAFYVDNKYILSLPERRQMIVYDRERAAWLGPWNLPFGISHMQKYIDSSGTEKWVLGSYENNQVYVFEVDVNSDDGEIITKTLRTRKTYFGDWSILNIVQFFYILFSNITGTTTVNLIIENRNGTTSVAKSFTVSGADVIGSTGWGADTWGTTKYGDSQETTAVGGGDELTRWGPLFKQARLLQIEVTSNTVGSDFELLEAKIKATRMGSGSLSSSQRV